MPNLDNMHFQPTVATLRFRYLKCILCVTSKEIVVFPGQCKRPIKCSPEGQLAQQLNMPDVCDPTIEDRLNFEASSNAKKRKHDSDWG